MSTPFHLWWVSQFGRPPLAGEDELVRVAKAAFAAGEQAQAARALKMLGIVEAGVEALEAALAGAGIAGPADALPDAPPASATDERG